MSKGFTIDQMLKNKKVVKKFRKDRADVSGNKNKQKKGYFCPAK